MITPSLGRIVWYTPADHDSMARSDTGACAAIVVYVHSARLVNLTVFDGNGHSHPKTSVQLVQPEDELPAGGGFCQWMPYQQQAAAQKAAAAK